MAIRTEIIRLRQAKNDTKRVLTNRGIVLNSDVRTEDMPPMITDMLRIERPYVTNYQYGWVNSNSYGTSATFTYENPVKGAMSDIYRLKANHKYTTWVCVPGTRFRIMWCTTDPTSVQANVSGTSIIRKDNPTPGTTWNITGATPTHIFTPTVDCFLIYQKDNVYNDAIKTYLFDFTYIDNPPTPTWITGE